MHVKRSPSESSGWIVKARLSVANYVNGSQILGHTTAMSDEKHMHYDHDDVIRSGEGKGNDFGAIVEGRINRRGLIQGGLVAAFASSSIGRALASFAPDAPSSTGLDFVPIKSSKAMDIQVPTGYRHDVVISWGDSLFSFGQKVDLANLNAVTQAKSFGYNNDFVGFLSLPYGSDSSSHGLLAVNHEYVNPELMFDIPDITNPTLQQTEVEMEAVGFCVVEVKKVDGLWQTIQDSKFNIRHTATTKMEITGPAAGDKRMKTANHPTGRTCTGTLANCSAGKTPWGTVLSGEENFQSMFGNAKYSDTKDKKSSDRYGLPSGVSEYGWEKHFDRYDASKHPNEPNHFGWIVEIDPYDPEWTPKKRTALGRCRHEAATTYVAKSGQIVMYTGDDSRFEYVYKFVSRGKFDPKNRLANRDLMDVGTLYVAKYNEDGTGEWLPLVFGKGPLTPANGFDNQADVVIDARIAGDLLGATKMDRPEDIEVNPVNEKVYVVCTKNDQRGKSGKDPANSSNPRPDNKHGHIIEMIEGGNGDHAATTFTWEIFLLCGDPADPSSYYAGYPKDKVSTVSCPDNICFDAKGNLWIATDGQEDAINARDGFFAVPTEGPDRGYLRQFMSSAPGAEVCGPEFTPDGTTAFLAIQHPNEGDKVGSYKSKPWPFDGNIPRPSIIAIQAKNGGVIGFRGEEAVTRRDVFDKIANIGKTNR